MSKKEGCEILTFCFVRNPFRVFYSHSKLLVNVSFVYKLAVSPVQEKNYTE